MNRRGFLKKSALAASGIVMVPTFLNAAANDSKIDVPAIEVEETPEIVLSSSFNQASGRKYIEIQEYLRAYKDILNNRPQDFAKFLRDFSPYKKDAKVSAQFNTSHGPMNMTVPAEVFSPCLHEADWKSKAEQWPDNKIIIMETGAAIGALHAALGQYNKNDPAAMKASAKLAEQDITFLGSKGSEHAIALLKHLETTHGVTVKEKRSDGKRYDSAPWAKMKEDSKLHLIR